MAATEDTGGPEGGARNPTGLVGLCGHSVGDPEMRTPAELPLQTPTHTHTCAEGTVLLCARMHVCVCMCDRIYDWLVGTPDFNQWGRLSDGMEGLTPLKICHLVPLTRRHAPARGPSAATLRQAAGPGHHSRPWEDSRPV